MTYPAVAGRRCVDCKEVKPVTAFSLRNREKGYFSSYCKPCSSVRTKAYNRSNPERVRENARRFFAQHPEKVKEYNKRGVARYRASHPDYHKQYHSKHKEWRNQLCREWYAKNKDRAKEMMRSYHARCRNKPAQDLFETISSVVPKGLPPEMREDVVGNILLSVYEGQTKISEINSSVKRFIREYYKHSQDRFNFVSLDAPIKDGEGLTLGEMIAG